MKEKQSKENRGSSKTMTRTIQEEEETTSLKRRKERTERGKIQNKKNQKFCLTMTKGILTTTKRLRDK